MIKGFSDILKQFTPTQRLIVLVLLLSFTSGSLLLSQYLKTDDCRPIIEENIRMHQDFAKISAMLRSQVKLEEKETRAPASASPVDSSSFPPPSPIKNESSAMDEILKIADSHNK